MPDRIIGWTCAALIVGLLILNAYELGQDHGRTQALQAASERIPEWADKCRLEPSGAKTCWARRVVEHSKREQVWIAAAQKRMGRVGNP